ncbi:hypothetical protein DRO37_08215 [Candidatus Bathyarchaeota archaeon]|nr:MAG: hypothetical protein DRO37_08215 [Candidatus Bathyarchaeota archaeon]
MEDHIFLGGLREEGLEVEPSRLVGKTVNSYLIGISEASNKNFIQEQNILDEYFIQESSKRREELIQ